MTPEEIYQAKVEILDILGCGVPAQHLLDCGVSPTALVVCLTELKLRIPEVVANIIEDAEHAVDAQSSAKRPKPPPPPQAPVKLDVTIDSQASAAPVPITSKRNSFATAPSSLPSKPAFLPPKPTTCSERAPKTPFGLPAPVDPQGPSPPQTTATKPVVDLDDIEQQRKQELLARRKVLQSLRVKDTVKAVKPASQDSGGKSQPPSTVTPSTTRPTDYVTPLTGADDMQIDLLIADAIRRGEARVGAGTAPSIDDITDGLQNGVEEAMEVEQALRNGGLDFEDLSPSTTLHSRPELPEDERGTSAIESAASRPAPPDAASPTPYSQPSTMEASRSSPFGSFPPAKRTSSKRPVAADFVDFATESMPPEIGYRQSRLDSSVIDSSGLPPQKRRKHFGPSAPSRVIIDLSEGESDSDEEDDNPLPSVSISVPALRTKKLNEMRREGSDPMFVQPSSLRAKDSKALWEEKQREIERMRELIRSMESKKKNFSPGVTDSRAISEPIAPPTEGWSQPTSSSSPTWVESKEVVVKTEEESVDLGVSHQGMCLKMHP